jgi:glycosyltransferase involved in cell wall biosynthesis
MIPNPINSLKNEYTSNCIDGKINIFLGINRSTYFTKGISFFEKALKIIKEKYADLVDITITENVPYNEYIEKYTACHILLDQVYGYDQGYNALEAMAKGKVVFTGAEQEVDAYYNLDEKVAVNALPSVDQIVAELSKLIENPAEIQAIGLRARQFIEKYHNHVTIASNYLEVWNSN